MNIDLPVAELIAGLLATIRVSAWLVVAPPFSNRGIPSLVKVALAMAIALPLTPRLAAQAPSAELGPLLTAVLFQVVVGLSLGFLTQLLFAAVQAAGELIDFFSGFTLASAFDPGSNISVSVFGRFYQLVAVTLLFALNGHLLLLRGFVGSFTVFPMHPVSIGILTRTVTENVGTLVVSSLEIAAPVLIVLFLAELALGLVNRAVPALNVLVMSFPVKILLTLSLTGIAVTALPGVVQFLLDHINTAIGSAAPGIGGTP